MLRVMIHGVLHLLRFDDKTEVQKREMRRMEDYWIDSFENKRNGF
jgi:ssRNA-specific RNase YbeY (16S rRNA maturation enzyme)